MKACLLRAEASVLHPSCHPAGWRSTEESSVEARPPELRVRRISRIASGCLGRLAQDLGQRRAAHLELLGRSARASRTGAASRIPAGGTPARARCSRWRSDQANISTEIGARRRASPPRRQRPAQAEHGAHEQVARRPSRASSARPGSSRSGRAPWRRARRRCPARSPRSPCARRRGRRRAGVPQRERRGRDAEHGDQQLARGRGRRRRGARRPTAAPSRPSRRAPSRPRTAAAPRGTAALDHRQQRERLAEAGDAAHAGQVRDACPGSAASRRSRPRASRRGVRTATAQCSGPCTSSPLRSAMPPRRTFGRLSPGAVAGCRLVPSTGCYVELRQCTRPRMAAAATSSTTPIARSSGLVGQPAGQPRAQQRAGDRRRCAHREQVPVRRLGGQVADHAGDARRRSRPSRSCPPRAPAPPPRSSAAPASAATPGSGPTMPPSTPITTAGQHGRADVELVLRRRGAARPSGVRSSSIAL